MIYAIKIAGKTIEFFESTFRIAGHQHISKEVIDAYRDFDSFKTEFSQRLEILRDISKRIHRLDSIPEYGLKKSQGLIVALENMRIAVDSIITAADIIYEKFEEIAPRLDSEYEERVEYFRQKYRWIEEIDSQSK